MKAKAGKLNERVALFEPMNVINNTNGEVLPTWTPRGMRWADMLGLLPSEVERGGQLAGRASAKLLLRLDSVTRAIKTNWRVSREGVTYEVAGVDVSQSEGSVMIYIAGAVD